MLMIEDNRESSDYCEVGSLYTLGTLLCVLPGGRWKEVAAKPRPTYYASVTRLQTAQ